MGLCILCHTLSIELLRDNDVEFYPDMRTLKSSADDGCDFCRLCWESLEQTCLQETVSKYLKGEFGSEETRRVDQKIWLRGEFHDLGGRSLESQGSQIIVSCGRLRGYANDPDAQSSGGLYACLGVFADPGTNAAKFFTERYSTMNRNPDIQIDLIRNWLKECQDSHHRCAHHGPPGMPTRIIDVGEPKQAAPPRLIVSRGICDPYVALSYCWGPNTHHTMWLTNNTIDRMQVEIDETKLTRSHLEAIKITRSLGFRYLWTDALCIIQDSAEDWAAESKLMARVYGNAALTIVAGRASDSRTGFITNDVSHAVPPCRLPIRDNSSTDYICVCLPRSRAVGPVSTRAWCHQEDVLSHRMIVYGAEQLFFKCQECVVWEDGSLTLYNRDPGTRRLMVSDLSGQASHMAPNDPQQSKAYLQWYRLLQIYTTTSLTYHADIFAALIGIAQQVQNTLRTRYLAGLWEDDLIRGLLWRPRHQVHLGQWSSLTRPVDKGKKPLARAPSWSWAAVVGPTVQHIAERHEAKYRDPANWCVQSSMKASAPIKWTEETDCDADKVHMPKCELQMYGSPVQVQPTKLGQPAGDYMRSMKLKGWSTSRAMMNKYGVLLEAVSLPGNVLAAGLFDIPSEVPTFTSIYCLRLVKDEGLLLQQHPDSAFSRVGIFVPLQEDPFNAVRTIEVNLR